MIIHFKVWKICKNTISKYPFCRVLVLLGLKRSNFFLLMKKQAWNSITETVERFGRLASESAAANPSTEEFAKNLQEIFKGSEKK